MVDATHTSYDASDRSYYAIIKKAAHLLAQNAGFPEMRIAELDIVLAEITSNLHKYATAGEILIGLLRDGDSEYIEFISIDSGPGMSDANRMVADGYSSTNTIGHGLGSIKRFSDHFEIFSQKGWGTVLLSRIYKAAPPAIKVRQRRAFCLSPVIVFKPGEETSGDGYYQKTIGQYVKFILADGLGHGPNANIAINEAVNAFKLCASNSPTEIIRFLHTSVRKTRGLVATIVVLDTKARKLHIAGVGNIAAKISGPILVKNHLAYNGIIGHNIPNTMNDQVVSYDEYNQITLCSDGIRSRWDINKFPGMARLDPAIQAAVIYKDHARRTDDMSVVIAKFN